MNLLIITQKADRTDPILGFFHRWLELFAGRVEQLTVIAQQEGEHALPANVQMYSLGKENGRSKLRQILRFWHLLWLLRGQYDCVLVHMTPAWVILGRPLWLLLRKRVHLWYEIRRGSWRLSLALLLVRKVFSATAEGLPRPHLKQVVTGHGVDTEIFCSGVARSEQDLIVAVGRITRSKSYDLILRAFASLPLSCRLQIAGGMVTRADEAEWEALQSLMAELDVTDRVSVGWIRPAEMSSLYRRASLMLHACVGGLDKAVLEAMASGCPVISSSEAAREILPENCRAAGGTLGPAAQRILALSSEERSALAEDLRQRILVGHSLPMLVERLVEEMR